MRLIGFLKIAVLGALAAPAIAAGDDTTVTRTLDALDKCRKISAAESRLDCFDKASASLIAARDKGELIVLDRERVVERRRARFGLAMGDDIGVAGAQISEVETTIRNVRQSAAYGRWEMELANGSVWQTIDPIDFPPKVGDPITLKKASLGGFRARVSGDSVLIKRVR